MPPPPTPLQCVMYSFGISAVRTVGRNGVNWPFGFFWLDYSLLTCSADCWSGCLVEMLGHW